MKTHTSTNPGFVMVLTLLVIGLATIMTTIMFDRGGSYVPYMRALMQRERAMQYALSGIALVEQLLSKEVEVEKKENEAKQQEQKPTKPTDTQKMQHTLKTLLPVLNKWQRFELKEDIDGADGLIEIYISSEDGKINLNKIFDFATKKFVGEKKQEAQPVAPKPPAQGQQAAPANAGTNWKEILTPLFERIAKEAKAPDISKGLEELLKKRDYPLNDVTELLLNKQFIPFKNTLYPDPSHVVQTKNNKEAPRTYTLTDLFTLYSDAPTIEPWLLSDSMIGVLGLQKIAGGKDAQKQSDTVNEIIKKAKVKTNWQKEWEQLLKPLYGEIKVSSPQQYALFTQTFRARYFSAIISATIGEVKQKLLVILERIENSQDTKTVYDVHIRKFSWI